MSDARRSVRISTFNVNGLRAILTRQGFGSVSNLLNALESGIACFQETKLTKADLGSFVRLSKVDGWQSYFAFCRSRGGYSGVATFCRADLAPAQDAEEGLVRGLGPQRRNGAPPKGGRGICFPESLLDRFDPQQRQEIDQEGRCIITDHGAFVLFNVYGCAVTDPLQPRFQIKLMFYQALELRVKALLSAGRSVLLVGDLNIAAKPADHCDFCYAPPSAQQQFYSGRPDRQWLNSMLQENGGPFIDVFRHFHPHRQRAFTVWNQRLGVRNDRHGSRVDYILLAQPQPTPQHINAIPLTNSAEQTDLDPQTNLAPQNNPAQQNDCALRTKSTPQASPTLQANCTAPPPDSAEEPNFVTGTNSIPNLEGSQVGLGPCTSNQKPSKSDPPPISANLEITKHNLETTRSDLHATKLGLQTSKSGLQTSDVHPETIEISAGASGRPVTGPRGCEPQTTESSPLAACVASDHWRSFSGSDHCPVWVEIKLDEQELCSDTNQQLPACESRKLMQLAGWPDILTHSKSDKFQSTINTQRPNFRPNFRPALSPPGSPSVAHSVRAGPSGQTAFTKGSTPASNGQSTCSNDQAPFSGTQATARDGQTILGRKEDTSRSHSSHKGLKDAQFAQSERNDGLPAGPVVKQCSVPTTSNQTTLHSWLNLGASAIPKQSSQQGTSQQVGGTATGQQNASNASSQHAVNMASQERLSKVASQHAASIPSSQHSADVVSRQYPASNAINQQPVNHVNQHNVPSQQHPASSKSSQHPISDVPDQQQPVSNMSTQCTARAVSSQHLVSNASSQHPARSMSSQHLVDASPIQHLISKMNKRPAKRKGSLPNTKRHRGGSPGPAGYETPPRPGEFSD